MILIKVNYTTILAIDPIGSCDNKAKCRKFFKNDTKSASLYPNNNNAMNSGMNVKSNFRNGGKNGTAKLKKDRSRAITASIPLKTSE